MVTDYDCWKIEEEPVSVDAVIGHLMANVALAKTIVSKVIPRIPNEPNWPEHKALEHAIMTDRSFWPIETTADLQVILERFI